MIAIGLAVASVIGIACGSAAFLDFGSTVARSQGAGLSESEWWHFSRREVFGGVRYTSTVMVRAIGYKETADRLPLPSWVVLPQPQATGKWLTNDHYEIAEARGWPWPCMSYRFSGRGRATARSGEVTGGIAMQPWNTAAWYSPRVLPYSPIWRTIFADLAVHWMIWVALMVAVIDGRRAIRRWRDQCPKCGYSLRGGEHRQCPECGEALA